VEEAEESYELLLSSRAANQAGNEAHPELTLTSTLSLTLTLTLTLIGGYQESRRQILFKTTPYSRSFAPPYLDFLIS